MTKQIYSKMFATALLLGTVATSAHAQFNTTGTYVLTGGDQEVPPKTLVQAGNTETLTVFQANVAAAFVAGTGGDITFDNVTFTAAPSFTGTYGVTQGNTLTVTDTLLAGATGTYGPGTDATNATSGSNYIGFAGASNNNFNFTFSKNLSDFGIVVINRFAARTITFSVALDNGTVVTPSTAIATSNGSPTFFEYAPTGGRTISAVTFSAPEGLTRFDDLGFVTASPAAAPEPSQYAALSLGILGIATLALRARKRSLPA